MFNVNIQREIVTNALILSIQISLQIKAGINLTQKLQLSEQRKTQFRQIKYSVSIVERNFCSANRVSGGRDVIKILISYIYGVGRFTK